MFLAPLTHPITDGVVVTAIRAALPTYATDLTVQQELPTDKTRRMVTVRNDSGPQEGNLSRRRYGINVWADDSVDAENMALAAMAGLRLLPGTGPISATDQFSGPYEIQDDPAMTVGTKPLTHYYFTFRASVKGTTN